MARFADVLGQQHIKDHLQTALRTKKVSHAYIIEGEKFAGKEMLAGIFAQALQCEKGGEEPCGECRACKQAISGNHPDIIYVNHEKAGTIGVDEVRTQLVNDVGIKPYSGPYKIYIMNEAEKLTPQSQNAILKTIEEPPAYAVIILLTTNLNSFLPTILSRCITLHIRPVPDMQVKNYLMKNQQVVDYKAEVCAVFARGNVGKAINLASNEDFDKVRAAVINVCADVREMDVERMLQAVSGASGYKDSMTDYLDVMITWYRDVLLYKSTEDVNRLIFRENLQTIKRISEHMSYENIEQVIKAIDIANRRLDANVNFELTMELLFLTMKECS